MTDLRGRYPGGPTRRGTDDPNFSPRGKVHLSTVSEIENRSTAWSEDHKQRARRKRLVKGLVLSVIVSGAIGAYLGFSSHRTDAELAGEMAQRTTGPEGDLQKQADRLINEMWKSEALEKSPRIR